MSRVERGYRFATIPEWVLYHPTLTSTAIRVYGCLDRHGQTPESCFPSYERIAKFCGISERSVPRPIAELAAVGAIEVVRRSVQEDAEGRPVIVLGDEGRQTSNGYRLAGDHPLSVAHESEPAYAQERGSGYASERGSGYAQERTEREQEEREPEEREENTLALALTDAPATPERDEPKGHKYTAIFLRWYPLYPRQTGKLAASRKHAVAVKAVGEERLNARTRAWADYWEATGTETRFIPYPATFLHQGQYETEPPAVDLRSEKQRRFDAIEAKFLAEANGHGNAIDTTTSPLDVFAISQPKENR